MPSKTLPIKFQLNNNLKNDGAKKYKYINITTINIIYKTN